MNFCGKSRRESAEVEPSSEVQKTRVPKIAASTDLNLLRVIQRTAESCARVEVSRPCYSSEKIEILSARFSAETRASLSSKVNEFRAITVVYASRFFRKHLSYAVTKVNGRGFRILSGQSPARKVLSDSMGTENHIRGFRRTCSKSETGVFF